MILQCIRIGLLKCDFLSTKAFKYKGANPRDFCMYPIVEQHVQTHQNICCSHTQRNMSRDMRFLTMWYVRPAKFLSLKGGCTGSSESTLVKTPHCWKSHVTAQKMKTQIII